MSGHCIPPQQSATSTKAWGIDKAERNGTLILRVQFLGGDETQKQAVMKTLARSDPPPKSLKKTNKTHTWADFANVEFRVAEHAGDIRVSFKPTGGFWSEVGTDAVKIGIEKPTMNLGPLLLLAEPLESDRATILHEFGHALGFIHEHQSPARGGVITLNEQAIYRYYLPKLGSREKVKSQIIDTYNVAAFSKFDIDSIMIYPMSANLNEQGININANLRLSVLDQAYVTLVYPPDLRIQKNVTRLMEAMEIADIPESEAGIILGAFTKSRYKTGDDIRPGLAAVREAFVKQNENAMARFRANATLLNRIDCNIPQSGISDFFRGLSQNKLVRSVVKNVAKEVFQQNGIDIIEPQLSETNTMRAVGRLVTHPEIQQIISEVYYELTGMVVDQKVSEKKRELEEGQKEFEELKKSKDIVKVDHV